MQLPPIPRLAAALAIMAALASLGCGQETAQSLVAEARADLAKKDTQAAVVRLKRAVQADGNAVAARVLLGQALLASGDPGGAVVELSKSLDQSADPEQVMPALARALLLSGQHKKLVALYSEVRLKDKAADAAFRTSLATGWALSGDKAKTDAVLGAVLAASPEFAGAHILQARIAAGRGEYAAAMAIVDQVLARDAAMLEAWHLKGEIQVYGLRDVQAAEPAFRKALEIDKTYYPAQMELTAARIRAGDMPGAKVQFEALRALAPDQIPTLFLQAQIAYYDKDYAKSRDVTQRILRVQPENVGALQMLSALEWQAGSPVLAARPLETALKIDPDLPDARINLAHVYLRLGQPTRALEIVKPLTDFTPAPGRALAVAAEASLQLNRLDDAEELFTRAAAGAPNDAQSRTALALTRLAKGDAVNAFTQLQTLAAQTKEVYADAALISARLRRGELDAALAAADSMLRKAPDNAATHELRGRVFVARDELGPARQAFEKALSLEPRQLSATFSLAAIDLREKKPEQALKRADDFVKADPGNYAALLFLADLRRQAGAAPAEIQDALQRAVSAAPKEGAPRVKLIEFLAGQNQVTAARTAAQEAVAAVPNDVQVIDALGQMQLAAGDRQQALTTFRSITNIDANNAGAHVRMAEVHRANGEMGAAVAELRRAIELAPRLQAARVSLVEILVGQKRPKEAIEIAKALQRREPTAAGGYLLEGGVYRKQKEHEAAAAAYRLGLQQAIDRSELAFNFFGSLVLSGKRKEAERFALEWLDKNPGDGALRYYLGEFYMTDGALPTAEIHLTKALALRPDYAPALNNLSWVLAQQRKPGAVQLARRALDLQPNEPVYLDTLATALASENQLAQALDAQRKAVQIAPADVSLRLRLARLAMLAGDKTLAKSELERVLAASAKGALRDEAAKLLQSM
jgi:putative PEP-CTERM system TPR-repeat lipoprotein